MWGRGAIDDKQAVMGHLEAVEDLLASGYDEGNRGKRNLPYALCTVVVRWRCVVCTVCCVHCVMCGVRFTLYAVHFMLL